MTLFMIFDHFVHIVCNFKNLKMHKNVRKRLFEFTILTHSRHFCDFSNIQLKKKRKTISKFEFTSPVNQLFLISCHIFEAPVRYTLKLFNLQLAIVAWRGELKLKRFLIESKFQTLSQLCASSGFLQ